MSSSPRNGRQIKSTIPAGKGASQKINWWDELPAVMSCPECGKRTMRRFSGPCRLLDGTLIPTVTNFTGEPRVCIIASLTRRNPLAFPQFFIIFIFNTDFKIPSPQSKPKREK